MASVATIESPGSAVTHPQSRASSFEKEIVDWCDNLYEVSVEDPDYQRECRDTLRMIESLDGKMWNSRSRFSRNRPVLPKAIRHFRECVSLLTDLALDFQIKSFDHFDHHSEFDWMLNQLCVHWAEKNKFEDRTYDCVLYGLLHTGPAKIQWNSTLQGGLGDVQLVPIAPWQWVTLGAGTDPQESECVVYFPIVTKDHLVRRFGRVALNVDPDVDFSAELSGNFSKPAHINKQSWGAMGPALRKSLGVKSASGNGDPYPKCVLKEFWLNDDSVNDRSFTVTVGPCDSRGEPTVNWAYRVEPGEQLYPRGRVICIAGGRVLEDYPNPYWHAKKPFAVYRPFRVPWKMSGDSSVAPWLRMNDTINKIMGGVMDGLYSIIEPTLIGPKAAFPAGDWESLDPGASGGKIKYNNNAPKAPEFMKKDKIPLAESTAVMDMISKELDMNSGSSAITQALNKKQVPGGDSLEMILSSRSLPIRIQSRALTSFVEDIGTLGVANVLQFYSVAHRVAILGEKGISLSDFRPIYGSYYNSDSSMKPEEFVRRYQFVIKPDSTLASQRNEKVQIGLALRKMGDLSQRGLFRLLEPNFDVDKNQKELVEEARVKIALGALGAAAGGKGQHKK